MPYWEIMRFFDIIWSLTLNDWTDYWGSQKHKLANIGYQVFFCVSRGGLGLFSKICMWARSGQWYRCYVRSCCANFLLFPCCFREGWAVLTVGRYSILQNGRRQGLPDKYTRPSRMVYRETAVPPTESPTWLLHLLTNRSAPPSSEVSSRRYKSRSKEYEQQIVFRSRAKCRTGIRAPYLHRMNWYGMPAHKSSRYYERLLHSSWTEAVSHLLLVFRHSYIRLWSPSKLPK